MEVQGPTIRIDLTGAVGPYVGDIIARLIGIEAMLSVALGTQTRILAKLEQRDLQDVVQELEALIKTRTQELAEAFKKERQESNDTERED